jgi:N-6 DNA Methylase/Eco57I restriction-modification methylase
VTAGLSGHLLSASFLEGHLRTEDRDEAVHRRFIDARRRASALGPSSSLRALLDTGARPIVDVLGFQPPQDLERVDAALAATLTKATGSTAGLLLIVTPWAEPLDSLWHACIRQALLRSTRWCLLFSGSHLRLVDASRPYSRRFVQFDLDAVADDEEVFAAFWFVMRRVPEALHLLVDESEQHGVAVCRSLKEGVLSASAEVLTALVRPSSSPAESFEQALTIVYRILFLLFAEARGLVPVWHPVYRDSYTIAALAGHAEREENAHGLWAALRAIARLAHAGCHAGDLRVMPFNGRLFAPAGTSLADRRDLDDTSARRALLALTTRSSPDGGARQRIAYRDLGVDQLGTVYETLLDYKPTIRVVRGREHERTHDQVLLERGSGIRKATGTFYTPLPIADHLVRRTLAPLVRDASPEQILSLRIVDPAMGSGAFLVAACRYLASAYETSLLQSGGCLASDIGERERAIIRRTIAERCLYGVDVNPMAVQLARLSLWLATLAADRPLTFLDHRLQTGDSLLGTWLAMLSRAPQGTRTSARRDVSTLPMFDSEPVRAALETALPVRFALESIPNDSVESVRAKEQALARLNRRDTGLSRWKRVADLWCAHWLADDGDPIPAAVFGALSDLIVSGSGALPPAVADRYLRRVEEVAGARRPFHWELEFPEVFFNSDGSRLEDAGFHAVIGNPPWDMMRADAGPRESRGRARAEISSVLRFARDSGVYTARSKGHANRYQLFTERALALARRGGRIGLVLPAGLATDQGSAALRRRLLSDCDVDALVSFENQRGVFPIHRSVRFQLMTATQGSPTRVIAYRPGERDPAALETAGDEPPADSTWYPIRITPDLIHRLSGEGLAIPDFRSVKDVAIAERAASLFPPAGDERGWSARFGRELNATEDRASFDRTGDGLPVVEGKHIEPFRVHTERTRATITRARARRLIDPARYARPRLAYRDVAGAGNRLTLIAGILPSNCLSTHTVFCLRTPLAVRAQWFLCGLFNSFVVNYLVRMRVTTHVTTSTVERLPLPTPVDSPRGFREIAALAQLLSRRDDTMAASRLQSTVARLYQLSADEFAHVLSTFPLIPREQRESAFDTYVATEAQRTRR